MSVSVHSFHDRMNQAGLGVRAHALITSKHFFPLYFNVFRNQLVPIPKVVSMVLHTIGTQLHISDGLL